MTEGEKTRGMVRQIAARPLVRRIMARLAGGLEELEALPRHEQTRLREIAQWILADLAFATPAQALAGAAELGVSGEAAQAVWCAMVEAALLEDEEPGAST